MHWFVNDSKATKAKSKASLETRYAWKRKKRRLYELYKKIQHTVCL